jgi:uncharacterized membrane protein
MSSCPHFLLSIFPLYKVCSDALTIAYWYRPFKMAVCALMISERLVRAGRDCGLTVNTASIVGHLIRHLAICCRCLAMSTAAQTTFYSSVQMSPNIEMSTCSLFPAGTETRDQLTFSNRSNTRLRHNPSPLTVCASGESELCAKQAIICLGTRAFLPR